MIERALARFATRVIAVCEAERRNAASVGPASRVRVVYNGVDPVRRDAVHPALAELRAAHSFVACAIAELRDSKGIDALLEAFARARREDGSISLAIAGDGPERASLEALAHRLGLGSAVRFLGATPGPDSVLAGADAFVNAAYAEAFPYTVIEAMSGGVPVIATDVGGTAEAIGRRGEAGVLVPARDADALARALLELARDPERRAAMGARGRAEYERRFTRERMLAGIRAVYAELGAL
ncbi:MAG TPA: glycosyltransferase [Solirubrobacterales bacterium]